ncbi:hypothetical protein W97_08255 [Coniosporium apollinis CBS 100218]|uniref:Uncharacterized protein n=1 Tax=Coniosporium apollinis (strain CBS 100218) TaxID=1168221 RepID=R7Z4A8_CONA1|nr:uncharacterized protein W97_08255 [Coniosporium apollinis CBS 100218]EON68997.1 hypothetical protein W97_08255 [Coniosporium apollinis CBS 100218]
MHVRTPFFALTLTLLTSLTGTFAAPATEPDIAARQAAPCNPDYVPSSCGACHYFRGCTSFQGAWIVPCPRCDATAWCQCYGPFPNGPYFDPGPAPTTTPRPAPTPTPV